MILSLVKEYYPGKPSLNEVRFGIAGACDEPTPILEETCTVVMYHEAVIASVYVTMKDAKLACGYIGLCF